MSRSAKEIKLEIMETCNEGLAIIKKNPGSRETLEKSAALVTRTMELLAELAAADDAGPKDLELAFGRGIEGAILAERAKDFLSRPDADH